MCRRFSCRCPQRHSCGLQVEGCADPLHLSDLLPRYVSANQDDIFFGAEHDILKTNLSGTNTFVNPPFSGRVAVGLKFTPFYVGESPPTRCVFVVPEPNRVGGREFLEEGKGWVGSLFFRVISIVFRFGPRIPSVWRILSPLVHTVDVSTW